MLYSSRNNLNSFTFRTFGLLAIALCLEWAFVAFQYEQITLPKEGERQEITLMTYNLLFNNPHKANSLKIIKENNPDVLFVQEITPDWKAVLDAELRDYSYQQTKPQRGAYGIGIYAKYPLKNTEYHFNERKLLVGQTADLLVDGRTITVCNAHLSSPAFAIEDQENFWKKYAQIYSYRKQEFRQLTTFLTAKGNTAIFIGDMNTIKCEPLYREMKKNWVDVYAKQGKGFGFNFPNTSKISPVMTLDYMLVRGKMQLIDAKVVAGGSSDHLAIVGKVGI